MSEMTVEELRKRRRMAEQRNWCRDALFDEMGDAIALAAELEAERDRLLQDAKDTRVILDDAETERDMNGSYAKDLAAKVAALEAENARFREAAQRPTMDVVIDSPIIGLSMVEELAELRRENARFQWREGNPLESGWYLVTDWWAQVRLARFDTRDTAWTYPPAQRWEPVLRWMELPEPFRLTPST